jgi:hypothetical protein
MQQPLPRDLASVPAGPQLSELLARIELGAVPDDQLHDVLGSEWRQLAHQQARVWAVMAEMGHREPQLDLPDGQRWTPQKVFESAADEIRAELCLTRRAAERELTNADQVARLPQVMQALAEGVLDRSRALVLADGCWDLTEKQTAKLLSEVLPKAGAGTTTALADRVRRIAVALDPSWAERRYKEAVQQRRVIGYFNRDGSATVSGQGLPADQAATACARVDSLAAAAKRAGAGAPIDHLRTELFLGFLGGRFHELPEAEIVAALLTQFPPPEAAPPEAAPPGAQPAERSVAARTGVELRVGLGTLMGLNDDPAEIAGWGTITASVARELAAEQRKSEWRYAIVDDAGQLLFDGITRRRPATKDATDDSAVHAHRGIVELHVPVPLLTDTALRDQRPEWSGLLTDLAAQYERQTPIEQDPAARFAGRPLRRRVQVTHQQCTFRGCRRPASECDLDHRRDHTKGGRTDEENQTPNCRHDHMLKTRLGWRLVRRDENTLVWISPLGRRHVVRREPIAAPLSAPIPRELPPDRWQPDDGPDPLPILTPRIRPDRPPAAPSALVPVAGPAIDPGHDPPPF